MSEQQPEQPEIDLAHARLIDGGLVGIEQDVAPNGRLVLSLDPDKVLGLAVVVDVEGQDEIPEGIKYAHSTMTVATVDRAKFCEFLSQALRAEAKGLTR